MLSAKLEVCQNCQLSRTRDTTKWGKANTGHARIEEQEHSLLLDFRQAFIGVYTRIRDQAPSAPASIAVRLLQ